MQNQGIEVTTYFENDEIDIDRLKVDIIQLLKKLLLPIFHTHLYDGREEDWETLMDTGWDEIGTDMFLEDIWTKTDGHKFVTVYTFINEEREWDEKLAIDIILIALERQTISPIINCKNLKHMVRPLWDDIGEAVFSDMEWYSFDYDEVKLLGDDE